MHLLLVETQPDDEPLHDAQEVKPQKPSPVQDEALVYNCSEPGHHLKTKRPSPSNPSSLDVSNGALESDQAVRSMGREEASLSGQSSEAAPLVESSTCILANEGAYQTRRSYSSNMVVENASFDDGDRNHEDLYVFSGYDLMISHLDEIDLDWEEIAERTILDSRRGLVVMQVGVLEEIIDEFIFYLSDDPNPAELYEALSKQTIGPRLDRLERLLKEAGLLDDEARAVLADLRQIVKRRNELTHGTLHRQFVGGMPSLPWRGDIEVEWVIWNRRTGAARRIAMSQLRDDLYDAIGCFSGMLAYVDDFVRRAPRPQHFVDGRYVIHPDELRPANKGDEWPAG